MAHFIKISFWLLVIFTLHGLSSSEKSDKRFHKHIDRMFDAVGKFGPHLKHGISFWPSAHKLNDMQFPQHELTPHRQIALLTSKVNQISKDMKNFHDDLTSAFEKNEKSVILRKKMGKFIDVVSRVERASKNLESHFQVENFTYKDVESAIKQILDKDEMALNLLEMVDSLTESRDDSVNIFQLLLDTDLRAQQVCSAKASVQQRIFNIYQIAHNTQVQGLLMLIFAHLMDITKTLIEKNHGMEQALLNYFSHTKDLAEEFGKIIENAPRDMWTCDPKYVKEGETYERFGRAFQKYLFNMRNFEPKHHDGNCQATCESVPETINYRMMNAHGNRRHHMSRHMSLSTGKERNHQYLHYDHPSNRCLGGTLKNCQTISDLHLKVCKSKPHSIERYSYIKGHNWIFGSESSCRGKTDELERPKFQKWSHSGRYPCNYCMCTCDYGDKNTTNYEKGRYRDTDRYIDLSLVEAEPGHVVTGVRIKKVPKTHTFHLQIKQAKLLADGLLSEDHWKNFTSYYPRKLQNSSDPQSPEMYKENSDYHKISYGNTAVYLDDVRALNNEEVVTGVKFKVYRNEGDNKGYLGLAVKFTKLTSINCSRIDSNAWHSMRKKNINDRIKISVDNLDLPTRHNSQNNEISDKSSYVELANSGLETDVGQNVLPFIDIQSVETNPPIPLTGVGLYHRGSEDSGGYLGLKVMTFNLKHRIPEIQQLEEQKQQLLNYVESNGFQKE